jgi:hypothetical protein
MGATMRRATVIKKQNKYYSKFANWQVYLAEILSCSLFGSLKIRFLNVVGFRDWIFMITCDKGITF